MKTIKTLALAALTAITAVTAPSAQAGYVQNGIKFHTPTDFTGHHAMIARQLTELGVEIVDGRGDERLCEKPAEDGSYTLGWYTGERNFMVLCYGNAALRAETLTHEAVHVIQDCRAGFNNEIVGDPKGQVLKAVLDNLSKEDEQLIVELYEKRDWKIEAEAFLLEHHPQVVIHGLSTQCGVSDQGIVSQTWKF